MNRPSVQIPAGLLLGATALAAQASAQSYPSNVLADGPLAYYSLGDPLPADVAINQGTLGAVLNGTHNSVQHRVPGALLSGGNTASFFSGGPLIRTLVPNNVALNPPANQPFTVEAWIRPTVEENIAVGQAPLSNRKSDGNRQGWVFFQRASTNDTSRTQGWNFRMYSGSGSTVSVDITGGTYTTGLWSHVALTWTGSTATLYVDGNQVATGNGTFAQNITTPFSVGAYADPTGGNPFTGDIDEVAFYPTALSGTKIQEHFNNAFDPAPAQSYAELVKADGAVLQQRMDEYDACRAVAFNQGTIAPQGNGIHFPGVTHSVPGALVASSDTAMRFDGVDKSSNDVDYATAIPYDARMHTTNLSWEAWVRPTAEGKGNAQCVFMNYDPTNSGPRTGWVLWQRGSKAAASGDKGWNLRMYNANGSTRLIDIVTGSGTGGYDLNQWQHLAFTYNQASLTAIFYVNGVQVATQTGVGAPYAPNPGNITPGIGGFANGRENPFYGDIDEVALYDKVLTPSLIAAHYANGTSGSPAQPYQQLIASDGPVAYYRMDETNKAPAANLGTLGSAALGTYVNSPAPTAGPQPAAYKGFETSNPASQFRGSNSYVELGNPDGLNVSGPITLEAWVQPAATQANFSNVIIGHGDNDTFGGAIYLRIEDGKYQIGSTAGQASAPVPAEDLGTTKWVHLAGTWSAGLWTLYRNGSVFATGVDATGPGQVPNACWAIGARGRWKQGAPYTFPTPDPAEHRVFSGGIAEAAIYDKALSASRVRAHFVAGVGYQALNLTRPGGVVTLEWDNGTLQHSDDLQNWFDVGGATSPYLPNDGQREFYRLRF